MNPTIKTVIGLISIFAAISVRAESDQCFREHLKEAIELNRERTSFYSQLTNGQSEKISEKLIQLESGALALTYTPISNFDHEFKKILPESNVSPMCEVFISMKSVPQPQKQFLSTQSIQNLDFKHESLKSELDQALKKNEIKTVYDLGKKALENLSVDHRTFCMSRHLIESMTRTAGLYFSWKNQVSTENQSTLMKKTKQLLNAHRLALGAVNKLDRDAIAIQMQGVPIICQDVPVIPIPEIYE